MSEGRCIGRKAVGQTTNFLAGYQDTSRSDFDELSAAQQRSCGAG